MQCLSVALFILCLNYYLTGLYVQLLNWLELIKVLSYLDRLLILVCLHTFPDVVIALGVVFVVDNANQVLFSNGCFWIPLLQFLYFFIILRFSPIQLQMMFLCFLLYLLNVFILHDFLPLLSLFLHALTVITKLFYPLNQRQLLFLKLLSCLQLCLKLLLYMLVLLLRFVCGLIT